MLVLLTCTKLEAISKNLPIDRSRAALALFPCARSFLRIGLDPPVAWP